MNVLIIDTLPIYAHGLNVGLVKMLPEARVVNTSNIDSFWLELNEGDLNYYTRRGNGTYLLYSVA